MVGITTGLPKKPFVQRFNVHQTDSKQVQTKSGLVRRAATAHVGKL